MMSSIKRITRYLSVVIALVTPSAVSAADVQYSAFLTQGLISTTGNHYFGDSKHGISTQFWEVGGNLSWQATENLRLSSTVMARDAGTTDNGALRIDHALFDYKYWHRDSHNYGVTAGIVKIPLGFYNETRDVASTRPSILLPQSVYYDNARNYLINSEAVYLYREDWTGGNYTRVTLGAGRTPGIRNPETETFFLGVDGPGYIEPANNTAGKQIRVLHERNGGKTKYLAQLGSNVSRYVPGSADFFSAGEIKAHSLWLGVSHDIGRFTLTSELFRNHTHYQGQGPGFFLDDTVPTRGLYFQTTYRPNAKWEHFARYDTLYLDTRDKSGTRLAQQTGRPHYSFYAKDLALGSRYHITERLGLSGEYHLVEGTAWLPIYENTGVSEKWWRIFALQLSYTY